VSGIEVIADNVQVSYCKAQNIRAIVPQILQASGFTVSGTNVQFLHCHAKNIFVVDDSGNTNAELGFGTGFGWASHFDLIRAANNVLYKRCKATNCQVGFDTWYHTNSFWNEIKTICCGVSILNLIGSLRTMTCDLCSECDPPMSITLRNLSQNNKFRRIKAVYCSPPIAPV